MAQKRGLGRGLDSIIPQGGAVKPEVSSDGKNAGDGVLMTVGIEKLQNNKNQPRRVFDEDALEELSDSIKKNGILEPLLVVDRGNHYMIVAGERRWRAAMKAGLKKVPVIVRDLSEQEIVVIALLENLQRRDLNEIEQAMAYKRLIDEFGWKQDEVAEQVSKSRTAVSNTLRLLKLCESVQQMIIDDKLSAGHARAIISVEDPDEQFRLAEEIFDKRLSVREAEKLARDLGKTKPNIRTQNVDKSLLAIYREVEENLKQRLKTKVAIIPSSKNDGSGKLQIEFYAHEDLEKLMDLLNKAEA
ncbi:MAG: ParB/RepB/Spo0J family partition protein [Lachnospiraceae bacterium]|nr:ParB/RepB/Spo0J family partition protein [Lachnospiraceae bacterium]